MKGISKCLSILFASATLASISAQSVPADKQWNFTWFGQSTNADLNKAEVQKSPLKVSLQSCTVDEEKGTIKKKGGKFTNFHDGISFYYTVINPATENFELTATVTVDFINPKADGQEGFGILALDSLGEDKNSAQNHYTNSAGILSWKFEKTENGTKKSIKDGLGARFVTNITPKVLAAGDDAVSVFAKKSVGAFSYDKSDTVKTGDVYRITLKKDNTGYHAIYKRAIASEDTIEEYLLYDNDFVKLSQLDKDHVYIGFAVARGVNATFSDIDLKITDPKTDPAGIPEPPEVVALEHAVDSPSSYHTTKYPFVYVANANGTITVTNKQGKVLVDNEPVVALKDFKKTLKLNKLMNDLTITFTPENNYHPEGDKHKVIGQYNATTKQVEQNYAPVTDQLSVIVKTYKGKEVYASPSGDVFGKGTVEEPLDINSALMYVKPGQKVVLAPGEYHIKYNVLIERGNSGTAKKPKTLTVANGGRAVLDFSGVTAGFVNWGDWWIIENIDITKTVGDIKGLQIAGNHNIVRRVNAYSNGDTGIQISGKGADPASKWPTNNLVESCVSYNNCDPAQNNADGFAAKITCGEGNVFRNCIAYSNIDDGWDLFAKIESGPIGAVLIDHCVAYRNGSLVDGSGNGDGNGFKLGGDGIAVTHLLKDSVAFENGAAGVTSNSNPALMLQEIVSACNKGMNVALYGKGKATTRMFAASGVVSVQGGKPDNIEEMPSLKKDGNFFYDGSASSDGTTTMDLSAFESTNTSVVPTIADDGTVDLHGLFVRK